MFRMNFMYRFSSITFMVTVGALIMPPSCKTISITHSDTERTDQDSFVSDYDQDSEPTHTDADSVSENDIDSFTLFDEDKSGPIFKATSGRTRRNSGLPTALCCPCNTVTPVTHRYKRP